MKEYIEYMDNISVDNALHEKIMKRARQDSKSLYRNRAVFRFARLAACVTVVLLCVWAIPELFNTPIEITPNITNGISPGNEQIGITTSIPSDPNTVISGVPDEEEPLCALVLNKADSQMSDAARVAGFLYFWYELTNTQATAVLPKLSFAVSSTAYYNSDGSLWNVTVYEQSSDSDIAVFNEYYRLTEIQFAPGEIMDDVIYNYDAITSDVYGIQVIAGVFEYDWVPDMALYIASFKMGDISYSIKLHDSSIGESGLNRLTEIVNAVIRNGAPDLSVFDDPVIPELRYEQLTLKEAQSDPDFGAYIMKDVPSRFSFNSAQRVINQNTNSLSVYWNAGYDNIQWHVSKPTEYDREHIVSVDDREKYDLSLYPIPRADSVPSKLREYVDNPVFLSDELTFDAIMLRAYQVDDKGDTPGWRMNFSVLYDDVLVKVNSKGVSPEQVWEMLSKLRR